MTLVDDLKAAKALIDSPKKWGKGMESYFTGSGPACAHEACRRMGPREYELRDALRDAMTETERSRHVSVPEFNDAETTTHADIMALFDRAIAAAEASAS